MAVHGVDLISDTVSDDGLRPEVLGRKRGPICRISENELSAEVLEPVVETPVVCHEGPNPEGFSLMVEGTR